MKKVSRLTTEIFGVIRAILFFVLAIVNFASKDWFAGIFCLLLLAATIVFETFLLIDLRQNEQRMWVAICSIVFVSAIGGATYLLWDSRTTDPEINYHPLGSFNTLTRSGKIRDEKQFPMFKVVSFIILFVFCAVWISPFIILFTGAFRSSQDAITYPGQIIFPHSGFTTEQFEWILMGKVPTVNGQEVQKPSVQLAQFGYWIMNSCFSAIGGTLIYLFVASLAAYAFVFIDFKYRNLIFAICIASMVIPGAATTIGNLTNIYAWKLNKSILALIIPGLGGVYGMYLIKTFFAGIPKDLVESAKMDGYSDIQIFFKIILPLGKTVLFVQGLFGFMGGWNDLIWPQMLYPGSTPANIKLWTLQVGMAYIVNTSKNADQVGAALAGGVVAVLPVLVVYLIAQNKIIEGMSSAGIKG